MSAFDKAVEAGLLKENEKNPKEYLLDHAKFNKAHSGYAGTELKAIIRESEEEGLVIVLC